MDNIYRLDEPSNLSSPALLIFIEIVRRNIGTMREMAGDAERLRPHVKTHKMPEMVRLLERSGIHKHKCATIAEAEMIARAGGRDVLLAYPLVGPNVRRFVQLAAGYPETVFRATVDDPQAARALSAESVAAGLARPIPTLVDLDVGMGRTGIDPARAVALGRHVADLPGLTLDGLHAYDGHQRDADRDARRRAAQGGIDAVFRVRDALRAEGVAVPRLVLGGTPTFPIHAALNADDVECSPGTCLLHDHGYGTKFPDLPFTPAALLLTRVISRPQRGRVCLDLGYKAVAADPAGDRVRLLGVDDAALGPQSEEHLVVLTGHTDELPPGTPLLAIPTHICPTCALHREALVVEGGKVVGRWEVAARDRSLGI
jgi:D-serine deaminase-like pyridoxal phosphate-dependent protein